MLHESLLQQQVAASCMICRAAGAAGAACMVQRRRPALRAQAHSGSSGRELQAISCWLRNCNVLVLLLLLLLLQVPAY
jgi:hypothetical protein